MDEKDIEYLQSLLKIPSVGARGVNAVYEEVKKQGKSYNNKTKTGFTLAKIKEWYESRGAPGQRGAPAGRDPCVLPHVQ